MGQLYDTSMGGKAEQFPSTSWSNILAGGDPNNPLYREKLEKLVRTYWRPVYAYIRSLRRKSVEDAKDLAQAFFLRLLEKEYLARIQPGRGSFRGYLKTSLKHFLINAAEAERARRPKALLFSLEASAQELERIAPTAPEENPDQAFEREWFQTLLATSLEALRASLAERGKEQYYDIFRSYYLESADPMKGSILQEADPPASATYGEVAARFGVKESDVRNYLTHCRNTLRLLMRDRVRDYVAVDDDVEGELAKMTQ